MSKLRYDIGRLFMNTVVRDMLKSFSEGKDDLARAYKNETAGIVNMLDEIYKKNHLDVKTKELICVAISTYARTEYGIVCHAYKAFEANATKDEIMEAGFLATACGGEAALTYMVTLLKECVEEFEKDFKNKKRI